MRIRLQLGESGFFLKKVLKELLADKRMCIGDEKT